MKAKYKIGQFIEASTGHGRITGVLDDEAGVSYKTTSGVFISEKEVTQAYNPILKRATRRTKRMATATPAMSTASESAVDMA